MNILSRQKCGMAKDELHLRLFHFIRKSEAIPGTSTSRLLVFHFLGLPGIFQNGSFVVWQITLSYAEE